MQRSDDTKCRLFQKVEDISDTIVVEAGNLKKAIKRRIKRVNEKRKRFKKKLLKMLRIADLKDSSYIETLQKTTKEFNAIRRGRQPSMQYSIASIITDQITIDPKLPNTLPSPSLRISTESLNQYNNVHTTPTLIKEHTLQSQGSTTSENKLIDSLQGAFCGPSSSPKFVCGQQKSTTSLPSPTKTNRSVGAFTPVVTTETSATEVGAESEDNESCKFAANEVKEEVEEEVMNVEESIQEITSSDLKPPDSPLSLGLQLVLYQAPAESVNLGLQLVLYKAPAAITDREERLTGTELCNDFDAFKAASLASDKRKVKWGPLIHEPISARFKRHLGEIDYSVFEDDDASTLSLMHSDTSYVSVNSSVFRRARETTEELIARITSEHKNKLQRLKLHHERYFAERNKRLKKFSERGPWAYFDNEHGTYLGEVYARLLEEVAEDDIVARDQVTKELEKECSALPYLKRELTLTEIGKLHDLILLFRGQVALGADPQVIRDDKERVLYRSPLITLYYKRREFQSLDQWLCFRIEEAKYSGRAN